MEVCGAALKEKPALSVQNLSKTFFIGGTGAVSLKTAIIWGLKKLLETLGLRKGKRSVPRGHVGPLHVLKGISFEVMPGESVAIVGRNGSGKSTLLSLIARIYRPTSGTIEVNGRIAPLLELGAGFHPDLTGIDNILFNAVVLGLTRAQVAERMDKIIEFSELGEQVYAPVRTLSSGMIARLGFAIAMHVDADILLVDEVLSVGDFEFEEKCRARIAEFRKSGGTILLVSHAIATIELIADRCIWIQHGEIKMVGTPDEVIPEYKSKSESDLRGAITTPS